MRARAVPVTRHRLGGITHVDFKLLGDALEQPTSEPQLVADRHPVEDADLKLPLAHHHFGVGALDTESRAYAGERVGLHDVASGHLRSAHAAVVRALGSGEAVFGPAVGASLLEEGVLLLNAEAGLETRVGLGDLDCARAVVGRVWRAVGGENLAHHQDVIGSAQRVGDDEDRFQQTVGVCAVGLVRARSVKAPRRRRLAVGHDLGLAAQLLRGLASVNPDVLSLIRHRCSLRWSRLHVSSSSLIARPRWGPRVLLMACEYVGSRAAKFLRGENMTPH